MSTLDSSLYWACCRGDKQLVLELLNPDNVNYVHPIHGDTPLHQACKQGWLDVVELLTETDNGCHLLLLTDKHDQSPLDYAKEYNNFDVVLYIQRINGSLYWACFQGNKRLVLELINEENVNYVHPGFGDTPLHQACRQGWLDIVKLLIEKYDCDPINVTKKDNQSALDYACQYGHVDIVTLLIEKYGCDPNVRNKDHQSVLHCACRYGHIDIVHYLIDKQHLNPLLRDNVDQLEPLDCALNNNQTAIAVYLCQHCISSDEMINPNRIKTTINLVKYILKDNGPWSFVGNTQWKTINGANILQLVGSSKISISNLPSAVMLEMLNSRVVFRKVKPDYKTSDGDNILELACQSAKYLSQIPSALIIKWLKGATINQVMISIPDSRTDDDETLIQLVCKSEMCISHISTAVLTKWLSDTTLIRNLAKIITPEWKTADGDTLLQLICQSKKIVSQISSNLLTKWLRNLTTTFEIMKRVETTWKTADGDTLFIVLSNLMSNSRMISIHQMKMVDPNWKSLDDIHFLYILFHSKVEDINITELTQHYILKSGLNLDNIFLDSEGNTALHIACQVNKLAVVSYLINQAHCDPNIKNKAGNLPLDMKTDPKIIDYLCQHDHVAIYSETIVKWMNNHILIDDATMLHIIKSLIDNHRYTTEDGSTLLHVLCMHSFIRVEKERFIDFLLTEGHCDPNCMDSNGNMPLQVASSTEIMVKLIEHGAKMTADDVFKLITSESKKDSERLALSIRKQAILWNPDELNGDGYTALHLACKADNLTLVNLLLTDAHCDPNCLDSNGKTPLQVTPSSKIMVKLIEYGAKMTADDVFKLITLKNETDSKTNEILKLSIRKQAILWNPNELNSDGYTALHLACKAGNPTLVNLLLTDAHCDPNCLDGNGKTPFQVTPSLKIMRKLIEYGANMTADDVFKLITLKNETDSKTNEILKLSIRKQAILWNPSELNSDGYTALHLACKANNPTRVNILLSEAHCDPNVKSSNEEVALQMTTDTRIIKDLIRHGAKTSDMYESYQYSLGTNKPIQSPVKVFIVGNPSVGKSTLTAALKKKMGIISRIFSGKVSGVDKKTVGIIPHDIENDTFGRVTLYDFAGHREFYSGHAALLQTAIQSTPPVFLLVVNLCEQEDDIIKNILYWISFLENQCASVSCKPHIILVGSHADALKRTNDKVKMITDSLKKNDYCFTNMEYIGFVAMNCQYHESTGMNDLRRLLIKSCDELRIQEPIAFNAHCFLVFVIDKFMNLTAVRIKTVSERVNNHLSEGGILEFLPKNVEVLYKICLDLNDRGHILLLKDRLALENSYIVIDKDFLLSKISGTVFAPEGFKQYKELSTNTGVVPLSKIAECFPDKDLDILIGFLIYLEFCHEISDEALHQLISEQYSQGSGERYYLFPGLISLKADEMVWQLQSEYGYNYFGYILRCTHPEQFFNPRFLQVLLLRLAFSFALKKSYNNPNQNIDDNPNQSIGIHRNCCLWKNGISWGSAFGMQTLVEVTPDNKSVLLLARFQDTNLLRCVKHRSEVISTILHCKEQFCSKLYVVEIFIDSSSPLQYPINLTNDIDVCTLQDLATAVMSDYECPSVVLPSNPIPATNFLSFEPYLEMKLSTVQQLCNEKTDNCVISEKFLSDFVQYAQASEKTTLGLLVGNVMTVNVMKDDQIYQQLLKWRDSDMDNQKAYHDLRQLVDQYSVFAGRNVLKLAKQERLQSSKLNDQEYYERNVPTLIVQGSRPKIYELQMLEFSDGRVLRIMESVAPQWRQMAVALGFSVARIESIEKGEHYKPGDTSFKIFSCWLEGEHDLKPPTWDVLIQCLKQANLLYIAEMLSNLQIIKKDDNESLTATNSEGVSVTPTNHDSGVLQRDHGGSLPSLDIKALEVTEGRGGSKIRVIESIASQWEEVAKALDMGQEDTDMIKTTHSDNDEEACREMLATWLEGNNGEVSWTAFSQALINAGFPELADSLKDAILCSLLQ